MPDMIYLLENAPRGTVHGHVAGFSLPLPANIRKRWDDGDLHRVTPEGDPWPGGDFLPGDAPGEPEQEPGHVAADAADEAAGAPLRPAEFPDGEPQRPRGNGSQEAWSAYAVAVGALSEDEVSGMSRDQIVAAVSDGEAG